MMNKLHAEREAEKLAWRKSLKVGDEVATKYSRFGVTRHIVCEIVRITKTRIFVTPVHCDGISFEFYIMNGIRIGILGGYEVLTPVTQTIRDEYDTSSIHKWLSDLISRADKLNAERLRAMKRAYDECGSDET